ncbi:MAG TPA: DUF1206 domain-containing protein [Mycobacteriales bacterium]|nr:DUF1206 domain-containing protein [Mycobacteriales bacterium]
MVTAARAGRRSVVARLSAGAQAVRRSAAVDRVARIGFGARALFYAALVVLTVRVALLHGGGQQTQDNANGALSTVCRSVWGKALVAVAAAGFVTLGIARVAAAVRDREGSWGSRVLTALQGIGCFAVAWVPVSFLAGNHSAGSEQQQKQTTAGLLGAPAGRVLVGAIGVIVLTVCAFQIRSALTQDYAKGMRIRRARRWVKQLVEVAGTVGIAARAVVLVPIGVFFVVAAINVAPGDAKGLDAEVLLLSRHAWGIALLVLAALGLAVFAVYSVLELLYRDVSRT